MSERIEKMLKMAEMEKKYAIKYDESVMGLENKAIEGLLMGVAYDSHKHAALYKTIAEILKGPLGLTDVEYEQIEKSLKKHIEIETTMLAEVKALILEETDPRINLLLNEIYMDEQRHHKFYKNLLEKIINKDLIFENDIWDQIWKDVLRHGAPAPPNEPGE